MSKNLKQVVINSVTEPGFLFGMGNVLTTVKQSLLAGTTNVATGFICLGVRAVSELRKTGYNIPLPRALDRVVENPGAALAASGVFNIAAAGMAATSIDMAKPETLVAPVIMTCFGTSNILWGLGNEFDKGSLRRRFLDSAGTVLCNTGMFVAAHDAPLAIKLLYAASTLAGIYLAVRNKEPHGIAQPYLTNAGGALASGLTGATPELQAANIIWSAAYLSVDALKRSGGIYQMFNKVADRFRKAPAPAFSDHTID